MLRFQILLALRFYATGSIQTVLGDLLGVTQPTSCRTIRKVTDALTPHCQDWLRMPDQAAADRQAIKFARMAGFPSVIGCIDGTHIRIQAPYQMEHEYVNRKNFHSINVQVS